MTLLFSVYHAKKSLKGSYFVWRAKIKNHYHLETSLEAVRPLFNSEVTRGRPRPSEAEVKFDILRLGEVIWVSYIGV